MRLHDYAASGNCFKVRLLLALLGRDDVEVVPVDLFAGETLTDAFAALNPARETPVLELDDGAALVQSNAILWFFAEGTPYLPDGALDRARVVQWLSFEQELLMPGVGGTRFRVITGRQPEVVPAKRALGEQALDLLDRHLAGRRYVVGETPTIADLSLYAYAHVAGEGGFDLATRPAVGAWLARVGALADGEATLAPYPANARPGAGRSIYDA